MIKYSAFFAEIKNKHLLKIEPLKECLICDKVIVTVIVHFLMCKNATNIKEVII